MLLFRSEEHVEHWCAARAVPKRPLLTFDQLWGLARAWYSSRLTLEARRPQGEEIRSIFESLGLTDPFWRM